MNNRLKNMEPFNIYLPIKLKQELRNKSAEYGYDMTPITHLAIAIFIKNLNEIKISKATKELMKYTKK